MADDLTPSHWKGGPDYGEGLIGRIDALEAKNTVLSRALAYAQDRQISLMLERRTLEARIAEQDQLLKLVKELIAAIDQMVEDTAPIFAEMEIARGCPYQGRQIGPELEALRQALAAREEADADR